MTPGIGNRFISVSFPGAELCDRDAIPVRDPGSLGALSPDPCRLPGLKGLGLVSWGSMTVSR